MAAEDTVAHRLQNKESLAATTRITAQVGLRESNKVQLQQAGSGDLLVVVMIPGAFSLPRHSPETEDYEQSCFVLSTENTAN